MFFEVLVPPAVAEELRHPKPRVIAVEPNSVRPMRIADVHDRRRMTELSGELDLGEAQAIALAIELGIRVILVDERDAYAVARRHGLEPVGVLGLLLRAKTAGLVAELRP